MKQSLWYDVIDNINTIDANVECMAIRTKHIFITVVYRPPPGNVLAFLEFLNKLLFFFFWVQKLLFYDT